MPKILYKVRYWKEGRMSYYNGNMPLNFGEYKGWEIKKMIFDHFGQTHSFDQVELVAVEGKEE